MRRLLVLLFITTLVVLSVGMWATGHTLGQEVDPPIVIETPGDWLQAEIKVTDLSPAPRMLNAQPAADQCGKATPLNLSFANTADGSGVDTYRFTQEPTDPVLGCMFGAPANRQGYRTAWYSLTAGDTSIVTITTEGTEYDTVLAVYSGSCQNPSVLACSDDLRGFQSAVSLRVIRGQTYLIEVADYRPGVPRPPLLRFSAVMHDGGANWMQVNTLPSGGVSRHAVVAGGPNDPYIYIIGGQTTVEDSLAPRISQSLYRYDPAKNEFHKLLDIPGAGVSNTTAVYLRGKIYIPGGFDGNTSEYRNLNLVYDVASDFWDKDPIRNPPIPVELLPNEEMFAWAAAAAAPDELSYYVTGGRTSYHSIPHPSDVVIPNVYQYMPASRQWSEVQPMNSARYAHTAAWVAKGDRGLCVAGGLTTGKDGNDRDVVVLLTGGECFNPNTGGAWQPTGPLNFPRYNAGSAIGPDGNWYIFGGLDAAGGVPETEAYDPNTNTWHVLGGEYSLGGSPQDPARDWPRGVYWGDALYVFGGNTPPSENRVISSVDRMAVGAGTVPFANRVLLPLSTMSGTENFLAFSTPLLPNMPVSGNFVESTQFLNGYHFDWPAFGRVTLRLTNVSDRSILRLSVYDISKVVRAQDDSPLTGNKAVSVTLEPGRYFVTVERVVPGDMPNPNQVYQLVLDTGQ